VTISDGTSPRSASAPHDRQRNFIKKSSAEDHFVGMISERIVVS
jgi:hypothetical protein